jgi:hypothetical protein
MYPSTTLLHDANTLGLDPLGPIGTGRAPDRWASTALALDPLSPTHPAEGQDMTATEPVTSPRTPSPPDRSDARPDAPRATSASPAVAQMLSETLPIVGFIPVAGPPALLLLGAWVLFALMLVGPFALLVTLALVILVAAVLVGLIGAILASPYLLVRHLHKRWAEAKASISAPAPRLPRTARIRTPVRPAARAIQEG